MEWEDAPDTEKAWRLSSAKEKTERSRTKFKNKGMGMEMGDELVSMVEDRDKTMLLEFHMKEERLEKQKKGKRGLDRSQEQQQHIFSDRRLE